MAKEINLKKPKKFGYFYTTEFYSEDQIQMGEDSPYLMDSRIVLIANLLRFWLGGPLYINSAGRSDYYNSILEKSSPVSQHLIKPTIPVKALDLSFHDVIKFRDVVVKNIDILHMLGLRGIGFYDTFIHLDVRPQNRLSLWGMDSDTMNALKGKKLISIL
jgi:hypothetical protein